MKELKFNEEMQRAIDEGRKTQTRRVIEGNFDIAVFPNGTKRPFSKDEEGFMIDYMSCPFGQVGDVNNGVRITDIRVERLEDIGEEDAIAEGVYRWYDNKFYSSSGVGAYRYRDYSTGVNDILSAKKSFESLWESIYPNHPTKAWELNPWVWVITFEKA